MAVSALAAIAGCTGDDTDGDDGQVNPSGPNDTIEDGEDGGSMPASDSESTPENQEGQNTDEEPGDGTETGDDCGEAAFSWRINAPDEVEPEREIQIEFIAENRGGAADTHEVEVLLEYNDKSTQVLKTSVSVDPGESTTKTHTATVPNASSAKVILQSEDEQISQNINILSAREPELTIVDVDAPGSIEFSDEYTWSITVENQGRTAGTFQEHVEVSFSETTEWFESDDPIVVEDIPAGESKTWESDRIQPEEIWLIQYRFLEYDVAWEVNVQEPDMNLHVTDMAIASAEDSYLDKYAEVRIENRGDIHATGVEITADWYEDGNYISSTEIRLEVLPKGKTASIREGESFDDASPDEVEAAVTGLDPLLSTETDSITINNVKPLIGDEVRARFQTNNTAESEQTLINVVAHAVTTNKTIIGEELSIEDWQAGQERTLDLEIQTKGRVGQVDNVEGYVFE